LQTGYQLSRGKMIFFKKKKRHANASLAVLQGGSNNIDLC